MGKCVHYVTEVHCIRVLLLLIIPYITVLSLFGRLSDRRDDM